MDRVRGNTLTQSHLLTILGPAWDETKKALNLLSTTFRSIEGYEDISIGLCLRNGSRFDVYSVIGGSPLVDVSPNRQTKNGSSYTRARRSMSPPKKINTKNSPNAENVNVDVLYQLTTKEFRAFFTAIRMSLGMKCFDWPEAARQQFGGLSDDPIPSGPGRANSGRDSLILMLRLCCESDDDWCKAVERELSLLINTGEPADDEHRVRVIGARSEMLDDGGNSAALMSSTALELAKKLPSDGMMVTVERKKWVSLSSLMQLLSYPATRSSCEWYIQSTPADGNCLFSAIMTAANARGLLPESLSSVSSMRAMIKLYLRHLSKAGNEGSLFRREWLASCMYDVDDQTFYAMCSNELENATRSGDEKEIENFLKPLRQYVSNWADMVGTSHWGGLLRIELGIMASVTGSVIEVLRKVGCRNAELTNVSGGDMEEIQLCDTRCGGALTTCKRADVVFPVRSHLPSLNTGFMYPCANADVRGGWIGPYPLLRVVLHERHYSACTTKHGYPIIPHLIISRDKPWSTWFNLSDTLVEAYASLNTEESEYYKSALTMIDDWREASNASPDDARHADALIMHSKHAELSVSMLSHLDIPASTRSEDEHYMLSDDIISSYMHLLEKRSGVLAADAKRMGLQCPPKCRYMDTWFFKSLDRGLTGPSSKRRRSDLSSISIMIVPALMNGHWLLAVCYLKDYVIGVYDPLGEKREDVFETVKTWLQIQVPGSSSGNQWNFKELKESRGCLQQGNVDCGVYICKAAESLGLGIPIRISQWDIPYVRKRMMVELFRQEAIAIQWPRG